ncbi:MAG TPA: efflux RND transporter permease subunit [Phycisphaerae bacterium]|nr:efflux RND transporter permease subunit [Phycisphaerae bacterium]
MSTNPMERGPGIIDRILRFCLENKLVVVLILAVLILWGVRVMPFSVGPEIIPRDPIPVDAIPDIGENQQVVFTEWPGRSPQDVEDQITYPLTTLLQGTPGFKTIRSFSMFGFSVVYVIFDDTSDFYWCRSRLLEKLNIARQHLPADVTPALGPDATGLGQVFWYTLEGSNGGFDLMELRGIQDWYVRYALQAIPGVSEVASVGGHVREYQIDVDPDAMRAHQVRLGDIFMAVQRSNIDVGAETIEWNGTEYLIRGKGFVKSALDLENIVLRVSENVPIYVRNVARVHTGPALRRGMLDKEGIEAVGGVVLVRYGANPLEVIDRVKGRIEEISPGLPRKTLADGSVSQVQIVPFYDRTTLIHETLGTLKDALYEQVLVTTFVVLMFLRNVRSCFVIAVTMPLAVLVCFILMKLFGIDSNLMSLGGIVIAIGTMVDMGIILSENIVRHLEEEPDQNRSMLEIVYEASSEISGAVTTAILMTVFAFLPIFALEGPEGRLFKPLAYTKTFALIGSLLVAILILPSLAHISFTRLGRLRGAGRWTLPLLFIAGGFGLFLGPGWHWAGVAAAAYGAYSLLESRLPDRGQQLAGWLISLAVMGAVVFVLTEHWMPLGRGESFMRNLIIVIGINLAWASVRVVFIDFYPYFLRLFLSHKLAFLSIPAAVIVFGLVVWLGFGRVAGTVLPPPRTGPEDVSPGIYQKLWVGGVHKFPGLGREFMPPLDEGSYLYMPTVMPHASIGTVLDVVSAQDKAVRAIPEVESVVGKVGRAETAIDPAPVSMIETVILYKTEYKRDPQTGEPVLDSDGKPIRQWRDHIRSPADIWEEIQKAAEFPGATGAPMLQPIAARLVMLQSGMRAPMGVKVFGSRLEDIEKAGYQIAEILKIVPTVAAEAVIPDRVVGKPYLEIDIDRERIARYGVNIRDVQDVIEVALGGIRASTTVEGRERYPIRVRYAREIRDSVEVMERILVPGAGQQQIPLGQLARIEYVRGPQEIKSEDNFLVSYVLFDKKPGRAEVEVVEEADRVIRYKLATGELVLPAGVHYKFAGSYENQVRFQKRLMIVLPLSLFLLFMLLYFQMRSVPLSLIIFTSIPVAWAGGFIGIWLISQPWFLNVAVFGHNIRDLLHFGAYNLNTAVWVGFIALFSVTADDGVVLATYLNREFERRPVAGIADIRETVIHAGVKRVRPCLMTSATTVLSLMPVLTSNGRGADVMIPLALPTVGGLTIELLSLFVIPVAYCLVKEVMWRTGVRKGHFVEAGPQAA